MTNRVKPSGDKYSLIHWTDADVPVKIRDCSFAGKLMPIPQPSENNNENAPAELLVNKKKRVTKKLTTVLGSVDENSLTSIGINASDKLIPNKQPDAKQMANKLSNHFTFSNQGTTASDAQMNKTSNNKLDQSLRISYSEMSDILKSFKPSYNNAIEDINKEFEETLYPEWFKLMSVGFNILLHGVGSKKKLIQNFCEKYLNNSHYIELLGYHHDLNAKNLVKSILCDVLELNETFKTFDDQITAINQNLQSPLYLIINNIDGNCLRDSSVQLCLSELASNKNIHIIATVDHINSSLLWDNTQYGSFKWIHFETNSLVSYYDEIAFENSLMLNHTGNVQLSSMIHILKSLTQNAKNIFLTMVEYVLNKENIKKNITFTKLYHECREKFYVSNELTLRAQLTEFIDHKLIKLKTESDGYETIYLLIDDKNLKLYLDELKDKV